jgi:hypothetical protein
MSKKRLILVTIGSFVSGVIVFAVLIVIVALAISIYLHSHNYKFLSFGPKGRWNVFTYLKRGNSYETTFHAGLLILSLLAGLLNSLFSYLASKRFNSKKGRGE